MDAGKNQEVARQSNCSHCVLEEARGPRSSLGEYHPVGVLIFIFCPLCLHFFIFFTIIIKGYQFIVITGNFSGKRLSEDACGEI